MSKAAIFLMLLVLAGLLQAQTPGQMPSSAARIVELTGQVSVVRSGGDLWALMPNGFVSPGQEIVTGPDGHSVLQLADGSRVEVFPNSRFVFRANPGNIKDLLDLWLGKVRIHIEKIGGQPNHQRVTSPTALIAVRGTTFEVAVDASETTTVGVVEGLVEVSHRVKPSKSVFLKDGDSLTVYASEPIAQSSVDKVRTLTKVLNEVTGRVVDAVRISRVPGGTPTTGPGTTPTTPTGTVGTPTPVGTGTGTTTPPTNGRPGGGQNGDTPPTTPGTGSGTGSGTTPGSGTGSGTGSGPTSVTPRRPGS